MLLGERLGLIFTALVLFWLGRRIRNSRDSHDFAQPLALALGVQLLIVPGLFALYNAVLLLPGVLLLIRPALSTPERNGESASFHRIGATGVVRPDQDRAKL